MERIILGQMCLGLGRAAYMLELLAIEPVSICLDGVDGVAALRIPLCHY